MIAGDRQIWATAPQNFEALRATGICKGSVICLPVVDHHCQGVNLLYIGNNMVNVAVTSHVS